MVKPIEPLPPNFAKTAAHYFHFVSASYFFHVPGLIKTVHEKLSPSQNKNNA
jgi:hypothetical protein